MRGSPPSTQRLLVRFSVGIAVAFAVLAGVSAWSEREPPVRPGSREVHGERVAVTREPLSYRIVYRLALRTADGVEVSEERYAVRRPFESRIETYSGGRRTSVRVSAFGTLFTRGSDEPLSIASGTVIASGDQRPASVLREAVERGMLDVRERREVDGRPCTVYRAGGPVQAGTLVPVGDGDTPTDFCVDGAGLVVEEVRYRPDGTVLLARVATEVDEDPRLSDDLFEVPPPTDPSMGFVEPYDRGDEPFWSLERSPAGFEHMGRFDVLLPTLTLEGVAGAADLVLASVSDVWTSGPDVVVVDQGLPLAAVGADPASAVEVDLGDGLGTATLVLDLRMNEIRIDRADAPFVRVLGTVDPGTLVRIARGLRR